ncbi:MAG: hypothetical protein ACE5GW_10505, partial [Planctomycetota bacterium]
MEPIRSFSELIEGLTEMVERTEGAPERIDGTFRLIERALAGAEDLELGRFVPGKRSYARHLIHRDPQERFTLLGLVWRPGQGTPVHDHPSWGVVGVIRNRMKFVNYLLDDEEATSRL